MHVRRIHYQYFSNLRESGSVGGPTALITNLRHGKININTLLRWCTLGLLAAYILIVTALINIYDQLSISRPWLSNVALSLLIMLLVVWLYVQYLYSEKRTESRPRLGNSGDVQYNTFYIKDHYKTNHRLIGIYLSMVLAAWIVMTSVLFAHLHRHVAFLPV